MTPVIRAAGAADFLALVPHLVGYFPTRSLVLVPFQGNRTLGAMRLDLPAVRGSSDATAAAATAMGMVCKVTHVDAVAVVVYTGEPLATGDALPSAVLARALVTQADACGLRVSEALCLGDDGWASYLDAAASVHPLADIPYEQLAVPGEHPPDADQFTGARLPVLDRAERERVGRALAHLERAMTTLFGPQAGLSESGPRMAPAALARACRMDDVPLLYEEGLAHEPSHLDPYDAAALIWCLERPLLRDVALMQWVGDLAAGDAALEAQMRWSEGAPYPESLAAPMWGEGTTPDPERLRRALDLTRHLAAAAPRRRRPGPLAAAAWLAWACGRSSHAARYAALALKIAPGHGLADIVLRMADAGHLPEWVYRRSAPRGPVTQVLDSGAKP